MDMPESPLPPTDLTPAESSAFASFAEAPLATPEELHPQHGSSFFFGRFGLRAGYGIAIFIAVFLILSVIGGIFSLAASGHLHEVQAARAYAQAHPHEPRPSVHIGFTWPMVVIQDGFSFLGMFGLCWFFHKGERRPVRAYGVGSYRMMDILPGAFFGLVMLSAVVGVLKAMHLLVFDGQNVHGAQVATYGLGWLLAFLVVGFSEEYSFRGYIQYTLMRGVWGLAEKISVTNTRTVAFWIAGIFWSLMFGVAHMGNGGENAFGLLQVVLAGITFTYALWRTGSLWWGIGFHCTWDWAQSFLFGVADSGNISVGRLFVTHPTGKEWLSGGADGPEGSIFATVALILTIVIIRFVAKPGMQPAIEQEPKTVPDMVSLRA